MCFQLIVACHDMLMFLLWSCIIFNAQNLTFESVKKHFTFSLGVGKSHVSLIVYFVCSLFLFKDRKQERLSWI